MDGFSKFGICLICMLALVLLAMTPNSATSNGIVGSLDNPIPASLPVSRQTNPARTYAISLLVDTVKHNPG
ncbi:MAG: hypothetical protein WBN88_18125 [Anderseniella sp.]